MPKSEGAHNKCFCGEPIVCVKKTYQGEERLSWVNESNDESHFSRNDDGTFNCNTTVIEDPKNKKLDTSGSGNPSATVQQQAASSTVVQTGTNSILSDTELIYRSLIPVAERIVVEGLYFGRKDITQHDKDVSTQCVLKSLTFIYLALMK